jgi:hypothetical protein
VEVEVRIWTVTLRKQQQKKKKKTYVELIRCEISGSHGGEYEDGCILCVVALCAVVEVLEMLAASIIRAMMMLLGTLYRANELN